MLPIATLRQMKADDKKSAERYKQRANTKGSAASEPLEIDNEDDENENDRTTTNERTTSSLTTATPTLTKVGIETPMTTTATPTKTTLSQPMTNKQRRRTAAEEKPHKCHPGSQ